MRGALMSEIVVALFPTEEKAQEAAERLSAAAAPEGVVVRGAAILGRSLDGAVSERKWSSRVPWRPPAGAVLGAVIGFLVGPIGAGIGFLSGGVLGAVKDLSDVAEAEIKLREIREKLRPGTGALVVDIDEPSLQAFSERMQQLGGDVISPGLKQPPE